MRRERVSFFWADPKTYAALHLTLIGGYRMRPTIWLSAAFLAAMVNQAIAQPADCASGTEPNISLLGTMLNNNCACSDSGNPQQWNETHVAPNIRERGTAIGALSAANNIGTYTISNSTGTGIVAYTYGSSTYTYSVRATALTPLPQTVRFCQRANASPFALNGTSYVIRVKAGECPPFPC